MTNYISSNKFVLIYIYIYTYFIVPTFVNEIYMPTFEQ